MALIACPECAAQVSDRSATCVKCGCPLRPSATDTAAQSDQQRKAVDMLARGVQPLVIAKSTGLPLKDILRLRSEVKAAATASVGIGFVIASWALLVIAIVVGNIPVKRASVPTMTLIATGAIVLSWIMLFVDRSAVMRAAGRAPDALLTSLARPLYFLGRGDITGSAKWLVGVDAFLVGGAILLPIIVAAVAK